MRTGSSSRLMHLDKKTGEITHTDFKHVIDYLNPGDCLVINDTKVIPARLYGSKIGTDAAIEILLLKRREIMSGRLWLNREKGKSRNQDQLRRWPSGGGGYRYRRGRKPADPV